MQKYLPIGIVLATALAISTSLQAWETQILACSYYDKLDSSANSSLWHPGLPWLWAKGTKGEKIYAKGEKIDGFFQVAQLSGCEDDCPEKQPVSEYENSTKSARNLCERALAEAFPNDFHNKVVMNMMVKSSFLSFNHSPVLFHDAKAENPDEINKIIIFGDSLSDQDNMKSWIRILPGPPYFGGRFTNGPNWVDFLHLETNVAIQNWAVGGAITRLLDDDHRFSTKLAGSVEDEINRFKEVVGKEKHISDPKGTLFVVWAGGNDYLSKLFSEEDINTFIDEPDAPNGSNAITKKVTDNIINHLESLYKIGARKFVVANMPDLGSVPQILHLENYKYTKSNHDNKISRLSRRLSRITLQHNKALSARIKDFVKENTEAQIIYGDTYRGLRNIVLSRHYLNPTRFFSYELDPDFIIELKSNKRPVQIHRACFTGSIWSSNICSTVCSTPERNLFWDRIHPTSFGHCLIALNLQKRLNLNNLMQAPVANNYFQRCRPDLVI